LDVQEDQVGVVFFDQVDGFETVSAERDYVYFGETFKEIEELVAGWALVVDDYCVDGHWFAGSSICNGGGGSKKSRGDGAIFRAGEVELVYVAKVE
jgi:hypothetical protein